jgi:subtilisin family serine protease
MARRSRFTICKRLLTLFLLAALVAAPVGSCLPGAAGTAAGAGDESPDADAVSASAAASIPPPDNESPLDAVRTQSAAEVSIDPAVRPAGGEVEVIVRLAEPPGSLGETPQESVGTLQSHANASQAGIERFAAAADGVAVEQRFWLTNAVRLRVDTSRVPLERVARVEGVTAIHENARIRTAEARSASAVAAPTIGSASTADATWGIDAINATDVWAEDTRGEGVRVAVLDTGVDADHPDLDLYTENASDPTYPGGWVKVDADGTLNRSVAPRDFGEHGTHTSGTVAGGDASGEHVGVAPGVELTHGAVLTDCNPSCSGTFSQIIAGMEWAVENDADVVSMSLGSGTESDALIDPVRNAESAGVVVVGAVGNGGEGASGSPANVHESLAVGAVNDDGDVPSFSGGEVVNRSDWDAPPSDWPERWVAPDVVAPGAWVKSTVPEGHYEYWRGTSMATPHVSGTAALVLSANPTLSPADVRYVLRETARTPAGAPDDRITRYGNGVVDAGAAVDAATGSDLQGTVVGSARSHGIANVSVIVRDADTGDPIENATTDADGVYDAAIPARGNVSITADAGFAERTITRRVGLAGDLTNVTLTVDNGVAVDGTVTEAGTGAPVENASVSGSWITNATTDDAGEYETTAAPRDATTELSAEISASGYDPAAVVASIDDDANATVDAALVGNANLSAQVVDAATGAGIQNATLTAARGNVNYDALANETGTVSFEAVPGDAEYELTVAAPDHYDSTRSIRVEDGEAVTLGEIPLEPRTSVAGTVIDAETNETLANATVAVERNGSVVATATTDAEGAYVVPVDEGTVNVTVDRSGFHANRTENRTVRIGDRLVVDAALAAENGSIEGTVLADDTGETLANATVRVTRNGSVVATRHTDENGTFSVGEIPRDEYAMSVSLADFRSRTLDSVPVGPGQNRTETVALVPEPATVSGTVRDAAGDPLGDVDVTAAIADDAYATTTDASGTYSLSVPRGRYNLTYAKKVHESDTATLDLAKNETAADVDAAVERLPVFFEVTSVDAPASVDQGDRVSVDAEIENLGTENGSQVVAYRFDGQTVDETTVTIAPGSNATATFSYQVPLDYELGEHEHGADANTSSSTTIAIEESDYRGGGGGGGGGDSDDSGSGGGGGGGDSDDSGSGGGGSVPRPSTWVEPIDDADTGTLVRIRGGYADTPATADFETAAGPVALTGATVEFASDVARSDVRFEARESPSADPPAAPVRAAGYFTTSVEYGNAADIDAVEVDIDVDAAALPANATIDDVDVYRHADGEWTPVATDTDRGTIAVSVAPDGEYAVAVDESTLGPDQSDDETDGNRSAGDSADDGSVGEEQDGSGAAVEDEGEAGDEDSTAGDGTADEGGEAAASEDDTATESDDTTGDVDDGQSAGDDGLPGFGVGVALLALVGVAFARGRGGR